MFMCAIDYWNFFVEIWKILSSEEYVNIAKNFAKICKQRIFYKKLVVFTVVEMECFLHYFYAYFSPYFNTSFFLHVLPKRLDMLYCDGVDLLGVDCTNPQALYINASSLANTTKQKQLMYCMCESHAISMRTERAMCDPQVNKLIWLCEKKIGLNWAQVGDIAYNDIALIHGDADALVQRFKFKGSILDRNQRR